MTGDLHQRARDVLAKLSIVAEGSTTSMDTDGAHAPPDSRPPVSLERIATETGDYAPARERDLHGHWAHRFAAAWDRPDRLYLCVLLAEEDLAATHHPGKRGDREATEGEILAFRGSLPELAARFGVTMKYGETVRLRHRLDPKTGDPWLWPDQRQKDSLSDVVLERMRADALDIARAMFALGDSQRRVSAATGIPRGTLQRLLGE